MTSPAARLRVLFDIATLDAGGAERQLLELLKHLDRSRFEPVLCLTTRQGALSGDVPSDVPVYAFQETPANPRRFGLGRLARWRFLSQVLQRERIDVVYDRTFQATLDTGPATWWRKTPRISAVVADPRIQMDLYFPRRQWLWRRFARQVYRTANLVLANSAGLRQQVIDYFGLPPDHVRTLPNVLDADRLEGLAKSQATVMAGLPTEPQPATAGLLLDPLRATDQRFRILTVGRIDEHKGHRDLLEAVRMLVHDRRQSQILWQIIGDGPARELLLEEVHRLNLGSHVQWLGVMTNPYPYYRAADLFCLPSLTEGLPNVLLEALAIGTPVVSTDCPSGPREILEDGRWGKLVPMQNPSALAEVIADRMEHPGDWIIRAAQAKPVIRERYAIEQGVRRFEELLWEVAGQSIRAEDHRA